MKSRKLLVSCFLAAFLMAGTLLEAQTPTTSPTTQTQPAEPSVTKLALRPSATTHPALRYSLLPGLPEQSPGNAATLYMIAVRLWPEGKTTTDINNQADDFLDIPIKDLPRNDVEQFLRQLSESLRYVDLAARRREAHWDAGLREWGFYAHLPYLNDMKAICNVLGVQIHMQLARRDWAGAEHTIQTGLAMARHLSDDPALVQGLVEAGVAHAILNRGVEEWIACGESPNLYWALSSLPSPFVDPLPISQSGRAELYFTIPQLRAAVKGELPAEQWPGVIRQAIQAADLAKTGMPTFQQNPPDVEAQAKQLVKAAYPRAKQYLLSTGMPKDQVDAMPADQIVGTFFLQQYRTVSEELWKGWELPFSQAVSHLRRTEEELANQVQEFADNPLIQTLPMVASTQPRSPRVLRARYAFAWTDRAIAMLRTIEALRDYAARHDGRPPQSLDQITDLPLPIDPFTGKPFAYRLQGQIAILDAPAPREQRTGWRYELTFVR